LYLKEIEFRFNLRGGNVEKALLDIIEWSAFSTISTRGLSSDPNFIKEKE
jgi:hypothetical protein